MDRVLGRLILGVLVFLLCNSIGSAQTGQFSGQVTDPLKAVVPKAEVRVVNQATSVERKTVTNDQGLYTVPFLEPGPYKLFVQAAGFSTAVGEQLTLTVGQVVVVNFELKVGEAAEHVTVSAESHEMNTTDGSVSTVVDRQFVENLPMNGRSFHQLISLTPGVVLTKSTFTQQGQFSINGQRADANYFTVDGVSANVGISASGALAFTEGGSLPGLAATGGTNNLVSVDAVQEFRVETSSYAPEFGRQPGGQISIATRSGTNEFHGSLFEYFRNDIFDANDWFANRNGARKPPLRQNAFGGVLGGKLIKDRTFFFFSYEGLRLRLPQSVTTLVPSVNARRSAPAAIQPLLNAYPLPNGVVFANEFAAFFSSYSDRLSLDASSIRIDHVVNGNLTLFGRYNHAPSESVTRRTANLANSNSSKFKTQTITMGGTWLSSSVVSTEFRFNFSQNRAGTLGIVDNLGGAIPPMASDLLPAFASINNSAFSQFFSIVNVSTTIGKNADNIQRQANFVDHISISKGTHRLKLGGDYRRVSTNNRPGTYGQFPVFLGLTGTGGALSNSPLFIGVSAFEEVTPGYDNLSLYGQDTWQTSPRLALTYGIRWELNPPPSGKNGKELYTVQSLDNLSQLALAPAGTQVYGTSYGNFAPRVGVAYQIGSKKNWARVLRGGFGLFYDLGASSFSGAAISFPYGRQKLVSGVPFPLSGANAAVPPFSLAPISGNINIPDPRLQLPRTYQWNVALQQSLGSSQAFSITYLGASGRRLLRRETLIAPGSVFVNVSRNSATSDYHALQVQFQRRLSRGLQALTSYTWSHSIDIASNESASSTPSAFSGPRTDRGDSDFDVRHALNVALAYFVPTPSSKTFMAPVFRNWTLNTIIAARSATPVNLRGRNSVVGFSAPLRPDVVPGQPFYINDPAAAGGRRFNRAAFVAPVGQQGTLGRNVLRGFGAWQLDFAVHREFHFRERLNLQFRTEFFNLFNHPNFGDPVDNISDPLFGVSTQMLGRSLGAGGVNGGFSPLYQVGGPRSIQFALKLQF